MHYDPIKKNLGRVFNKTPWLRILFYRLLDLLLLRSWHVRKDIRKWAASRLHQGNRQKEPRDPATPALPVRYILDAGSGFGQYTWFLSGLNPHWFIEAVDVKEEQVADCNHFFVRRNRRNVLFETGDLTRFVQNDRFDFILSVDVMEHIEEDEVVFRNFYDSLTQEGMVLISTPSDQGGSDVHDHDTEGSFIGEHVRDGYNILEIQEKLRRAGFRKTEARYTYGAPGQAAWKWSMKYPILLLNHSKLFFMILPFYYLLVFPMACLLNYADTRIQHKTGTGLVVKAWK